MSLETFGTFLMLRMELVLVIGFKVKEIARWLLDILELMWFAFVTYMFHILTAFIFMLSLKRQDWTERESALCGSPAHELYFPSIRKIIKSLLLMLD